MCSETGEMAHHSEIGRAYATVLEKMGHLTDNIFFEDGPEYCQ